MTKGLTAVNKLALLVAAGAMMAFSFASVASAQSGPQYDRRGRPAYGNGGPNVVYQQGRTKIYVTKRSWLDGGTEVLPGDRKFTDYAYPPTASFATRNNNRPLERQPLNPASDLGGEPTRFPLY
jgi:hypothetical protein